MNIRSAYSLIHSYPELPHRAIKQELRSRSAHRKDPLSVPLRRTYAEAYSLPWRTFFPDPESGEWWKEYCIVTDQQFTDEELDEIIRENWISNCSPYDCTGKVFTSSLTAVRVPCGTLFIHCKGIDV